MCGDKALRNVVIVTNMWGRVAPEVGDAREGELAASFFKHALDNGATFLRHDNTVESAHGIIRNVLKKERVTLQIQEEINQGKWIEETAAGKELLRELDEQVEKRRQQLRELQEMLNQTEAGDGETRQELQQEISNLRKELATLSRASAAGRSTSDFAATEALLWGVLATLLFLWMARDSSLGAVRI